MIGIDIIKTSRMNNMIQRFGDKALLKFLSKKEITLVKNYKTAAGFWATKEACSKALGTGLAQGVYWRDMGVVNLASGKPTLVLEGRAKEHLTAMVPHGFEARIDLTITDDYPLAQAIVIISCVPTG